MIAEVEPFRSFCPSHLVAIAATVLASAGLALWVRHAKSRTAVWIVCGLVSAALAANEIVFYGVGLSVSMQAFLRGYLPVHVCGVAAWLTAWLMLRRSQWAFEIIYYLGLGGTFQAVITPNLADGFPAYRFWQFFVSHGFIVVGAAVATWGFRMRPRRGAALRVFGYTNIYLAIAAGINWLTGANYMFLCAPPSGASPFFFLPWPWYLLFLEFLAFSIMLLLDLPFVFIRHREGRRANANPDTVGRL